ESERLAGLVIEHKRLRLNRLKRSMPLLRPRVQRRNHKSKFVLEQRHKRELAQSLRRRLKHKCEVNLPSTQEVELMSVISGFNANHALGIALTKFAHDRRQDVLAGRRTRAHPQSAMAPLGQRFQ